MHILISKTKETKKNTIAIINNKNHFSILWYSVEVKCTKTTP